MTRLCEMGEVSLTWVYGSFLYPQSLDGVARGYNMRAQRPYFHCTLCILLVVEAASVQGACRTLVYNLADSYASFTAASRAWPHILFLTSLDKPNCRSEHTAQAVMLMGAVVRYGFEFKTLGMLHKGVCRNYVTHPFRLA